MRARVGPASITGRSVTIVSSTGRRRAAPRSAVRYGYFAATNGFIRIFAVNSAPPSQASDAGPRDAAGRHQKQQHRIDAQADSGCRSGRLRRSR